MNADRLLRDFDRLSDAPNAVWRLRRFVVNVAVRGQLLDGTGATDGRGHADRSPGSSPALFNIPTRWDWVRIDDLEPEFQNGASSRGAAIGEPRVVLRLADIKDGSISLADTREIVIAKATFTKYSLAKDDLLVIRVNGSGDLVGRFIHCNLNTNVAYCDHFIRLRTRGDRAHPKYLALVGNSPFVRMQIDAKFVTTAGQKTINQKHLGSILLPLPPLAEQVRIVAKVDELMAVCDELETAQKQRERRRKQLSAASLARLTAAEDTPVRVAEKDVAFYLSHSSRILTRPAHVVEVRQTILDLAIGQNLRVGPSTSAAWAEHPLGDLLAEDSRNGYSRKPDGVPSGIPILKISAGTVRRDGIVDESEYKLIGKITPSERSTYGLREGDLLACRFNGNREAVGRLAMFCDEAKIAPIFPDKLIRIRVDRTRVLPSLVRWFSRSQIIANRIAEFSATTVGNWGISATNLKRVTFPIPPMDEQHALVAKVDELMAVCDELERSLEALEAGRTRALEAVLHRVLEEMDGSLPELLEAAG